MFKEMVTTGEKNGKCNHIPLVGGESFFFEATSEENLGFC
jgi:hypothetical protein